MKGLVWKVFIPHELLNQPFSFLFGKVSAEDHAVFITASTTNAHTTKWLAQNLNLVGTWDNNVKTISSNRISKQDIWVKISFERDLRCELSVKSVQHACTAVIYDSARLVKSIIIQEKCQMGAKDNLTSIFLALQSTSQILNDFDEDSDVMTYNAQRETSSTWRGKFSSWMCYFVALLYLPFGWIRINQSQHSKGILQKALTTPSTVNQLGYRAQDLTHAISSQKSRTHNNLRNADSCCRQFLDTTLGLVLMYILMQGSTAQVVAHGVLTYGDVVAGELKTLLHWLMGAPAGLKLNSQLTHLLSQFFQYHIYLWTGYLYLLKPVLGYMVYYSSIAGIWGLTVQLSLYQDIFSTLTLHIYCFYVYAARLYRLQLYALASFWRLFRGKKWNVLRERVDSAVYNADQLFLGTLLFTVLLFLLPTTLIYYVVFTLLRLLVLTLQGIVGKVRRTLNTIPVWSIWLWMSKSPQLADGALFHIKSKENEENQNGLVISMELLRVDLSEVMALTGDHTSQTTSLGWSTFCRNLLCGDLVFPWIRKK